MKLMVVVSAMGLSGGARMAGRRNSHPALDTSARPVAVAVAVAAPVGPKKRRRHLIADGHLATFDLKLARPMAPYIQGTTGTSCGRARVTVRASVAEMQPARPPVAAVPSHAGRALFWIALDWLESSENRVRWRRGVVSPWHGCLPRAGIWCHRSRCSSSININIERWTKRKRRTEGREAR